MATPLVSLGMYDAPPWSHHVDQFWTGLRRHFLAAGISDPPLSLERERPFLDAWLNPTLLFSQTCGLPLQLHLPGKVTVVGRPVYAVADTPPGDYRSVILARPGVLNGNGPIRLAINSQDSHSGFSALAAFVDGQGLKPRCGPLVVTGGHALSVKALRDDRADMAAVDNVTMALYDDHQPGHRDGLEVVGTTAPMASLPFITRPNHPDLPRIREALDRAFADSALSQTRAALLLDGWMPADFADYTAHKAQFDAYRSWF